MKRTNRRLAIRSRIGYFCGFIGILLLSGSAGAQFGIIGLSVDTDAEPYDAFGSVMTRGNFNGDSYEDLVVGLPYEDIKAGKTSIPDAGAVEVIYGSATGLTSVNRQFLRQGANNVEDVAEASDYFGCSLAAADFNYDNFDDLAIGACREDVGGVVDAGAVHVIYGSPEGLSATAVVPDQFWHQSVDYCVEFLGVSDTAFRSGDVGIATLSAPRKIRPCFVEDMAEAGDGFGWALASRQDRDRRLVIGIPYEDVGSITDAGAITLLYGSVVGLQERTEYRTFLHQDTDGMPDVSEPFDRFGYSLAVGDFDADGSSIAVGVPFEDVGAAPDAGAVIVISSLFLDFANCGGTDCRDRNQLWHQSSPGILDVAEPGDLFGWSLAVGDFTGYSWNGQGYVDYEDLAIGVPSEDIVDIQNAGAVNVIYGSSGGLSSPGNQVWHQNSQHILDTAEAFDYFGYSLAAGDFDAVEGFVDLAIGVPFEDIGSVADAGAVNVIYGYFGGLVADPRISTTPNQFWHQDISNVEDAAEIGDRFGFSLAAGDFNRSGNFGLAVGVPSEDLSGLTDAGGIGVIYGSIANSIFGGLNAVLTPDQFWTQTDRQILPPTMQFKILAP